MKFSELVRLLEKNDFRIVKGKDSIRYYSKAGWDKLIRVDYYELRRFRGELCMPSCYIEGCWD